MEPLPPDPYAALGLPRDTTQNAIKTAYRKLALKYHPDKAKDKGDEFHKIQSAYEAIGEEDARAGYDAQYKLQQLKKEQAGRFKPGPTAHFDVRTTTTAFDVRGGPRPDFVFQARGPPRFETSERRPPTSNPQAHSSPRPSMFREESDYFGRAATSRKFEAFDDTPRRPPSRPTRVSPLEMNDKLREEAKKDKLDGTAKLRTAERKKRDQARGYDRKAKAASIADSDSESADSAVEYIRRDRMQENIRFAHVRPKVKKDSDDEHSKEQRARRKAAEAQASSVKDYIKRSRVDGAPIEKGSPPPPYVTSDAEERLRSARTKLQDDFEGQATARPSVNRKSSSKPDKKTTTSDLPQSTRPSTRRTGSNRESIPAEESPRRPPTLFTANSTPPELQNSSSTRRARTTSDTYREEVRAPPPDLRRAETQPSPRSSRREPPAAPLHPSGLRHTEKVDTDSGYSTSNSPDEKDRDDFPPQPASTKYRYPSEEPESRTRYETRQPATSRDRLSRSPSPMTRSGAKERTKGPPVSRSASYATEFATRGSDPERDRPSARRAGSSREDSERHRSTSTRDDSARKPAQQRPESKQSSSRKSSTDTPRPTSASLPMRTGLGIDAREKGRDGLLYGEVPRSRSPADLEDMVDEVDELKLPRRERSERKGDRASKRYMRDLAAEDAAFDAAPPSRRSSDDKLTAAQKYMSEMKRPTGGVKRAETFANA